MDIYLQIMLSAPNHSLPADKAARRLTVGDIIGGGLAADMATIDGQGDYIPNDVISSPRTGFVFIKDVPNVAIQKIKQLAKPHNELEPLILSVNGVKYQKALLNSKWYPFVSQPAITNTTTEPVTDYEVATARIETARAGFQTITNETVSGNSTLISGDIYIYELTGTHEVPKLRSKFGVKISDIPQAVRQEMQANKYITFTWTQVKNYLREKWADRLVVDGDLD